MKAPGASLLELAGSSRREFFMCAPFAKEGVVSRVVTAVPDGVQIRLFTRWRPDEVAAGVSDTGVLQVVRARGGIVYLHDRLHAKYFRNESCALIGSANLTATALGWTPSPNLELLVSSVDDDIRSLETLLAANSTVATDEIAQEVDELAALLPTPNAVVADLVAETVEPLIWVPTLRMPSDLFGAYAGDAESLTSISARAAANDLFALDLPGGLSHDQFDMLVGHRLHNQPLFKAIDNYLTEPRRFGEMRDLLTRVLGLSRDEAEQAWQTVVRWMLEFLPKTYLHKTFRYSEFVALARTGFGL